MEDGISQNYWLKSFLEIWFKQYVQIKKITHQIDAKMYER